MIIFGLTALTKPILKSSGLYALQGAIGQYTVATLLLVRNQLHHQLALRHKGSLRQS
jgi:heme A synthase